MITIFMTILNVISSLIHLVINIINGLISLIVHIPTYISFLTVTIGYLPAILIPYLVASVSIYVVLFIIGRSK